MPGLTETGMAQQIYDQFDPKMGSREATMKVFSSGRSARPEEIADLMPGGFRISLREEVRP